MSRFGSNGMKMVMFRRALLASVAMLPVVLSTPDVVAQQITSSVRGTVSGPSGAPVVGARITVTDSRTGRTASATTSAGGVFAVSGLEVGGPYTVLIDTDQYVDQQIPDLFLSSSGVSSLNISLEATTGGAIEEIVVTASANILTQLAIGAGSSFGIETLESLPSISHDFRDTIRLDPRVIIDPVNDDNITCLGGSNKFNSFTIDGVRTGDSFGLNASGLPSRNTMPIPFDSVREIAVEFSPFDVEYGQFTGCAINAVTKSGSNEFHGGVFALLNTSGISGDTIDGDIVVTEPFKDYNWGADIGGPVIKDKLFFYAAYEETDDGAIQSSGPIGGGFANESGPTQAQVDQIQGILETVYGHTTLGTIRTLPEETRRILGRVDWFISDQHRLALTYTRLREAFTESDDFNFVNFAFANNFEISGSQIETYSARLFSDWSENLSTEVRISRLDNHDIQNPLGGGEAQDANPVIRIFTEDGAGNNLALSGPGQFRSANSLVTQIDQLKFKADYVSGNHTYTAGYELDQLDVFNLFVVNATGSITFASIADLQSGLASKINGDGSFTGNINDAGATFSRSIHTLYFQDKWQATPELTVQLGLRYDFYKSSDNPTESSAFVSRYGFTNSQGFDGLDILLPRLGITYDAPWDYYGTTTFRAGAGVFTGGDPTVWFSNAFTNFGGAVGFGQASTGFNTAPCTAADLQVLDASGNFTGLPACIAAAQQIETALGQGRVAATDPNFKLPSVVRGSFGFTHDTDFDGKFGGFFDDWRVDFDIVHTRKRNAPDWVDLTLTPVGFAPDGRLLFNAVDPLLAGCNAVFLGPRIGFSPGNNEQNGLCDAGGDDQDILLTNVNRRGSGSTSVSILLNKDIDYTLWGKPANFDISIGYAFTSSKNINPGQGSTATSNFEEVALTNINDPELGPSQFDTKHNFTLAVNLRHQFVRDLWSRLSIFYSARSGRPFSYTYDNNTPTTAFGDSDNEERNLIYVPTGPSDPLVDFSGMPAADVTAFFEFLDRSGLSKFAGQISPRNGFRDDWFKDLDLRFAQDLPTPWEGHRFQFFFDIENFLNLLGDSSNVFRRHDRGDVIEGVPVLDAAISADGSQYIYTNFSPGGGKSFASDGFNANDEVLTNPSLWAIQLGIRYKF